MPLKRMENLDLGWSTAAFLCDSYASLSMQAPAFLPASAAATATTASSMPFSFCNPTCSQQSQMVQNRQQQQQQQLMYGSRPRLSRSAAPLRLAPQPNAPFMNNNGWVAEPLRGAPLMPIPPPPASARLSSLPPQVASTVPTVPTSNLSPFSPTSSTTSSSGTAPTTVRATSTAFYEVLAAGHHPLTTMNTTIRVGMRDVAAWLKSLRLHKYTHLFQEMTYDEMMSLDDIQLDRKGVTKGARKKILQSVDKLKQRPAALRETEQMLTRTVGSRCLNCAIATLRQMLGTPIHPYSRRADRDVNDSRPCHAIPDDDLAAMICRVLNHVHTLVFGVGSGREDVDDEYLFMILNVYDRILSNEAFTASQKNRVLDWKREARKFVSPAELRRHRVNTPHTGKCDSCLRANQDVNRADQRTIYKNLMSVREIARFQKALGIDPSLIQSVQSQQLLINVLVQSQLLQQQQQEELLRQQFAAALVTAQQQQQQQQVQQVQQVQQQQVHQQQRHSAAQPFLTQPPTVRPMEGRPLGVQTEVKPRQPLFGPQPSDRFDMFETAAASRPSVRNLKNVTCPPSPTALYPTPQTSPVSEVYSSRDIRSLCSPDAPATQNDILGDFSQMQIGTWNGAQAEEKARDVKKGVFDLFSDATSGYSSSGSERGSAGSPETDRRPSTVTSQLRSSSFDAPFFSAVPSVDVGWLYSGTTN